ncbi:ABC transporter ATP-binding protein [Streptosporangium sp. NPDC002721]|uniref:ABC transporter ATP-binding protein n=1 Tax=Streptosporangium sp. NPDC002721 TaxID=3366188 RepID=UPI0036BE6E4C
MSEPLLRADGLSRSYRLPRTSLLGSRAVRHAVREVTFELAEGSSLGIVGESGAGKSTLIRLLLALDRADAGTVRYRGRDVRPGRPGALRWFRREVAVVLQDPMSSLDPRMTIGRTVAQPLRALAVPGDHAARVAEVLTAVGLDPEAGARYPHQFSGGQRQRAAIARALAPRPRVLVGDEPVSALDVSTRAQVLDLLAGLAAAERLSVIVVSHDLGVVRQLCDQVLILHDGAVVEQGPTARVFERPGHAYTRTLLDAVPRLPI